MKTRKDFPTPEHYVDYLLMFGTDEEKAHATAEHEQWERERDQSAARDIFLKEQYKRCLESPYYWATHYGTALGGDGRFKTSLSEEEFNDIFNNQKGLINNDKR